MINVLHIAQQMRQMQDTGIGNTNTEVSTAGHIEVAPKWNQNDIEYRKR